LPNGASLFSHAQGREIRDRYRAGETARSLAFAYEASLKTVRLILRGQAGYPLGPDESPVVLRSAREELARIATRNREAVAEWHAQGKTSAEAAELSGLAWTTVQAIGRELGLRWPRKPVPVAHGTLKGYRRCTRPACDACRAANTQKMRDYMQRQREKVSA
jgi:hypothetical protein